MKDDLDGLEVVGQNCEWDEVNKHGMVLRGWVKMDNALIREIIHKTNPQTAMVYLIILSHRNAETAQCYPSVSLLARETGYSERTIQRMLNSLVREEMLIINSGKMNISNNYYFPREQFYKPTVASETARKRKTKFRKQAMSKRKKEELEFQAIQELESTSINEDDDFPF